MDAHHRKVHILLRGWTSARTHSEVGCLALLPGESSTAAPKKASMNPKDSDSTASLYLVPSQLLEEQKTGRGTQAAQNPGAWGSQKHPPSWCAQRDFWPHAVNPAQPAAWLQEHSHASCAWEVTSAAAEAMATCRKQAAGRAGLGNLKQH